MNTFLKIGCCWLICACMQIETQAQSGKLPPFRMYQTATKIFRAQDLPMGKPILLVYFSPDCDHCEVFTKNLLKNTTALRKTSVAMITYYPLENLQQFVKKFSLGRYPNFYAGTEGNSFFVKKYFKIMDLPFAALYTKNGDLVKTYSKNIDVADIVKRLEKLK